MRKMIKLLALLVSFYFYCSTVSAQNDLTGINDSVINLTCAQTCVPLNFKVPHLKSSESYSVVQAEYKPYLYATPTGNTVSADFYDDDVFSEVINLPFPICFYDQVYNQVVMGSNGVLTFDVSNAAPACNVSAFIVTPPIPFAGGTQCNQFSIYYPRASIMGVFMDLNSASGASPVDRKIEWRIEGTSPARRFVASWYHVGVFGNNCGLTQPVTFQIVINEATSVVEVFIEQKACFDNSAFSSGLAILGVQNWDRDQATAAPGKNATNWTAEKEGYRFIPSGTTSRFIRSELLTLGGALLQTATAADDGAGFMDIGFANPICPVNPSEQYIVRTIYTSCIDPLGQVVINDTVTINRSVLPSDVLSTQSDCGPGTGTIKAFVLPGSGTSGPYTYTLLPNNTVQTPSDDTARFTGLAPGNYTVRAEKGGCIKTIPVTITSSGTFNVTHTVTQPTCLGAANGTIRITSPAANGTNLYSIQGGPWQTSDLFSGLQGLTPPATYAIRIDLGGGCIRTVFVSMPAGTGTITGTAAGSPTSCSNVSDGSVTVTPPTTGGPYEFSINGGTTWQTSNIFNGLPGGNYNVIIRDVTAGCRSQPIPANVALGTGLVASAAPAPTSCRGASDGSIRIASNGTAPFTIRLNSLPPVIAPALPYDFTGLAAGTYTVTVVDAPGCQFILTDIVVAPGPAITIPAPTTTPVTCPGVSNGTITINSGMPAPVTFVLDGTTTVTTIVGGSHTFNNVSAGAHTITVTGPTGCTTASPINVNVGTGTGFTVTPTPTAVSCLGASNGSIFLSPGGGTAPYTFVLNPGGTTQTGATTTFAGLAAGTYSSLITDANGCQFIASNIIITSGAGLNVQPTPTGTTCTGINNGSVALTTNGTAPFTWVLDGTITQTNVPGNTTTFINLAPGSHSVTATDANGCTTAAPVSFTITAGTGFTVTPAATATSCWGGNDGRIVLNPSGGTAPYTFVLNPGGITLTGPTATFTGLAAGAYTAVITDANGCQNTQSGPDMGIPAGAGLHISTISTLTSCAGIADARLTVTANTGTAPYTFIVDGTNIQANLPTSTAIFTNLAEGMHTLLVRDVNGCMNLPIDFRINPGSGFTATHTSTTTTCLGANNGGLRISPVGGTAPFTFVVSPGNLTQTGAIGDFTGLAVNTYSVLITDAAGCQFTLPNMSVTAGPGLDWRINPIPTTCTGAANGQIIVTPLTGTGPFTVTLDGSIVQTGGPDITFTGVGAGPHTIFITDALGCSVSAPIPVTVPAGAGYTASFTPTSTSCAGVNNGSIEVRPQAPGVGPYTFVLTPGNITQTGATTTFTGLAPGDYSIQATDANGCQVSQSNINVAQGGGLLAGVTLNAVTCFGGNNGRIIVSPTNGSGPYTFVLNPGNITQTGASATFNSLVSNTYTISITDAAGCTSLPIIHTITQPTQLFLPTPVVRNVSCNGATDGLITVNPSGGTITYVYSLDNINFKPENTFAVPQGVYSVFVRDANGCGVNANNVIVTEPPVLNASINSTGNATCGGGADGAIQVAVNGGTAPYQYSLDGTNFQASAQLNAIPGTYTVTVRDANNCRFTIPNVVVGLTDNLTLTATTPPPICEGKDVRLQLTSNATSYSWTAAGDPHLSSVSVPDPLASPVQTTTYTVTATLGNCTRTADVTVTVLDAPEPDAGLPDEVCFGQDAQLQGSGGTDYLWSPATFLDDPTSPNPQVIKPDKTITYTLRVTDGNGCTSVTSDAVTITVTPPIKIAVSPKDTIIHASSTFQLKAISAGLFYEWTPSRGLSDPTASNPVVSGLNEGEIMTYLVKATTAAGCEGTERVTVRVFKGPEIYVATAFTPNGDDKNELFIPIPVGIKELKYFRVYNRWGQLMFSTSALNHGWDGKTGGMEQASGVYVWMVDGVTQSGQHITKKGTVTLIR